MQQLKIIIEKHPDGYVAYPRDLNGIVVGEGNSFEEALADVRSAIRFHIETFDDETHDGQDAPLEVFTAEVSL
jgi:predicted RNase H-like HicB family nuclease